MAGHTVNIVVIVILLTKGDNAFVVVVRRIILSGYGACGASYIAAM